MSEESKTPEEVQTQSLEVEQVQEITAKEKPREKDPKRVAAGKRLAAISQKAKEEKMRRLLEQENDGSWKQYILIAMGISVLGFASYRYLFAQKQKKEEEEFVHEKVHVVQQSPKSKTTQESPKKRKRGKPISMFDD